jgi:prepilin-type N-terminal cleavage/methylation domain-containing protein
VSLRRHAGFTLIEVLIVVVIMAILAATVIPKMSTSNNDAKEALLRHHLRVLRGQIELYKVHHNGNPPGNFATQLVNATDASGNLSSTGQPDAAHPYGPYLKTIPVQPISNSALVRNAAGTTTPTLWPAPGRGWLYQPATGRLWVDHDGYPTW